MKVFCIFVFSCVTSLWAQTSTTTQNLPAPAPAPASTTIPNLPDDTVIAIFDDGTKFNMGDFKKIYGALPPDTQQMAVRDRKAFLQWWAGMRKLADMAEKEKLDQESPTRETLVYARTQILAGAKLSDVAKNGAVEPGEIVNYYESHKEQYKSVKVKAIYISFTDDASAAKSTGKKLLTEAQAKAKAERLLKEIRGGADFVKLVKENSDDETSRDKEGDFITLRASDNVPEAVRKTIFAMKKGDVSEPVSQQNGFYLFRAEDVAYRPLSQVRDEIFSELKQVRYNDWMNKATSETKVQFTSPEFLGLTPMPAPGK